MPIRWVQEKIRLKRRIEKKVSDPITTPFVTVKEAAARVGVGPNTIYLWIETGVIPRPMKWGRIPRSKRPLRKQYVENLRDCVIIKNSAVGYHTRADFKKLCHKMLWGHH